MICNFSRQEGHGAPEFIVQYEKDIKHAIYLDIQSQAHKGGLIRISKLGRNSEFNKLTSVEYLHGYKLIKATTNSNQLASNLLKKAIYPEVKNILILTCNKGFNKRHKLFDSSSTSLEQVEALLALLMAISKTKYLLENVYILDIDAVTGVNQIIETGNDDRTFITEL